MVKRTLENKMSLKSVHLYVVHDKKKVPTWDTMKRRQKEGPRWCALCRVDEESVQHLFILFPFVQEIWKVYSSKLGQDYKW